MCFVKCEGERLQEQAKNLVPVLVPGTDIGIHCIGCPTLVDGKISKYLHSKLSSTFVYICEDTYFTFLETYWSGTDNFQNCYLCKCGRKDLEKRSSPNFSIKNLDALKFGFSPLHCLLRSFEWFLKNKTYSGIRAYAA